MLALRRYSHTIYNTRMQHSSIHVLCSNCEVTSRSSLTASYRQLDNSTTVYITNVHYMCVQKIRNLLLS